MSQSTRGRRADVAREDARPGRAAPRAGLAAQSSPRRAGPRGLRRRLGAVQQPVGPRGAALLVAALALVLVGAGAYPGPQRVPVEPFLAAAPVASTRAVEVARSGTPGLPPAAVPAAATRASGSSEPGTGGRAAASPRDTRAVAERKVRVPATGPGTYRRAHVNRPTSSRRGRLYRFDVRVERGLDIDPEQAALAIAKTLEDKRSWRGTGRWRFQLVAAGQAADLHAYLATPGTTDRLCAPLRTRGEVSCQAGNKVVLNAKRWVRGAPAYGSDVAGYRQYLVNHEFGHALGHGHLTCPRSGRPAPVMLQQTKGLGGCRRNPWPSTTGD